VSGHGPFVNGRAAYTGVVGEDLAIEEGKAAARLAMVGMLSTIENALGSLDVISGFCRVLVFLRATPTFADHPAVADGASDLLYAAFGEARGEHARSAIGVQSLSFNIPVEIEAILRSANPDRDLPGWQALKSGRARTPFHEFRWW
jgi:enamine deaminase RidA (YjgF/YER057c/UK114 family)